MFVRFASADDRGHARNHQTTAPSWEWVETHIAHLDGRTKTTVTLAPSSEMDCHMCVSGQWDGKFMVYFTENNVEFISLIDPGGSATKTYLFVGGQDGEFEERKCVPESWALQAARYYFDHGKMNPSLTWERD